MIGEGPTLRGMEPRDYYRLYLDLDRLHDRPRTDTLRLLENIRADIVATLSKERARIVSAEVKDQAAYHKPGAQTRAAKALGLSKQRISQMLEEHQQMKDGESHE